MSLGYRWDLTVISLMVAVAFTGLGFWFRALFTDRIEGLVLSSSPMAAGILTMHFLGMLAMVGPVHHHYRTDLVLASGLIALCASLGALWLTNARNRIFRGWGAAALMGLAICGMHYTAMEAAVFTAPTGDMDAAHFSGD